MSDTQTEPTGAELRESIYRELAPQLLGEIRTRLGLGPLATIPATGLIPDVVDGQLIEAAWGNAVRNIGFSRWDTFAALQAGWPAAPNGSRAVTLDTFRTYTKRGTGATGWQPDTAGQLSSALAFAGGAGVVVNHDLGRVPSVVLAMPGQNASLLLVCPNRTATTVSFIAYVTNTAALFTGNCNVWWFVA